jgi:hypothetical protein
LVSDIPALQCRARRKEKKDNPRYVVRIRFKEKGGKENTKGTDVEKSK